MAAGVRRYLPQDHTADREDLARISGLSIGPTVLLVERLEHRVAERRLCLQCTSTQAFFSFETNAAFQFSTMKRTVT